MARPDSKRDFLASDRPRYTYPLCGAKRWKTRGTSYKNLNDRPSIRKLPKPYIDPKLRVYLPGHIVAMNRVSIGTHAAKLLMSFIQREDFWCRVEEDGWPIELVGAAVFDVKERMVRVIHSELKEHDGPWGWFRSRADSLFKAGKIPRGAAIRQCPIADLFFETLLGGEFRGSALEARAFGAVTDPNLGDAVQGLDDVDRNCVEYIVTINLSSARRRA